MLTLVRDSFVVSKLVGGDSLVFTLVGGSFFAFWSMRSPSWEWASASSWAGPWVQARARLALQ